MDMLIRSAKAEIQPAKLVKSTLHVLPSQLLVAELFFDVPLDYREPKGEQIRLFGRAATRHETPLWPGRTSWSGGSVGQKQLHELFGRPWMSYLEGGPGGGNREPQNNPVTRLLLARGYQMLYLDYRGTGMSTPVSAATLRQRGPPEAQAAYLRRFRADSIVRDLEAVRQCLTADQPPARRAWSLLGQSFGGFVSLTYLSFYPAGVREVFLTGGLAPVGRSADEVYRATYRKALERNAAYFRKFPEDADTLRVVGRFLNEQPAQGAAGPGVPLPSGGALTFHRVLTLGYAFGFHDGFDKTHATLLRMRTDLDIFGLLTRPTLAALEQALDLDVAPLYGVLHEPIYCYTRGVAARWAAQRVAAEFPEFRWLSEAVVSLNGPLFFSGEMIYPFMFDTFPELIEMKEAANIVAAYDDWEDLYDEKQLAANRVPVYAASYIDDLYVDFELARQTARLVANTKVFETNTLYHNALRVRTDEVVGQLFRLRDEVMD